MIISYTLQKRDSVRSIAGNFFFFVRELLASCLICDNLRFVQKFFYSSKGMYEKNEQLFSK